MKHKADNATIAITCYIYISMTDKFFPRTQGQLIQLARGGISQRDFAARLGVDKSCMSRYESGKLGAPVKVIDYCLQELASQLETGNFERLRVTEALSFARRTVAALEVLVSSDSQS